VLFVRDGSGALLCAARFHPALKDLEDLLVLRRDARGIIESVLEADRATWVPPVVAGVNGRWRLVRARQITRTHTDHGGLGPLSSKIVSYPEYYACDLTPEAIQLRQSTGWIRFLSLRQLGELERREGPTRTAAIRTKHARIAAPFVNIVLVLLGLPFFLSRSPATVLSDAGKCMMASGTCYVSSFVAQSLQTESSSAVPAWIPIFIFGTLAVVLFDRMRT
jgi:lipopolysaccharide export LptBFGC system permease protein LptF